jgi:glycerol-3-phosphate acyltransferase PlsX
MIRTIAVDATGGDYGPDEIVKAAAEVSLSGEVACHVVGDGGHIESLLAHHDHDPRRLTLTDAGSVIGPGGELPAPGPWTALEVAADLVRRGEADAAVSAGDTGACVRTWIQEFPLLPGVSRPALASFFPRRPASPSHPPVGLILDVGATLRCHPRDYLSLALMGTAYYESLTGHRPRVGLLNVGAEPHKGGEPLSRSAAMLSDLGDRIDFVGNVEGSQLLSGHVDVVLCDGFTGNVLLKMLEGVAETAGRLLHEALHRNLVWRLGILMLSGGLRALREATDYAEYGGSPLLGSSAVFIKAHGRSQARALANAIRTAARVADAALPNRLAAALGTLQEINRGSWLRLRPSPSV